MSPEAATNCKENLAVARLPELGGTPLVSVLIVNYNYARYLPEAIESLLQQTYQNFELVICDDGSEDESREVIARYATRERRIKVIAKENAGVAAALNDSFRMSSGAIIAMLDADDVFTARKLERTVEILSHAGRVGLLGHTLTKVDSAGAVIGQIPQVGTFDRGELRDAMLRTGCHLAAPPTSALSMRRECAEVVFPIPEMQFRTEADAYMRTMAALFFAVQVIEEPLTKYRVHSSNVTASSSVDLRWCERVMSAGERVNAVVGDVAERHGWRRPAVDDNALYSEMLLVRDYLQKKNLRSRVANIRRLQRAASNIASASGKTDRAKAVILSVASLLPGPLGRALIGQVYQPSPLKRLAGRLRRPRG